MAEVKNNFLKSKMNKDLDDRLVPVGEYRHAQNVSIAKSEGNSVGALENILGNDLVADFLTGTGADEIHGVEIIGQFMDVKNDRIIVFMTNYLDTSSDALSNFASINAYNAIGVYNINTNTSTIAVTGRFLNFSKTHQIYGVNVINNLLFWTDNRNQPRKINLSNKLGYYTIEDTISVSKYYPHQTIDLIKEEVTDITIASGGIGYTGMYNFNNVSTNIISPDTTGIGLTVDLVESFPGSGIITSVTVNNPGSGYYPGQQITVPPGDLILTLTATKNSTMRDVVSDYLPNGTSNNPYRQPYDNNDPVNWSGNPEYLKDKFVRFSYRFKFDDGEYSLIAPFTQSCFIPKQDGYFIDNDDTKTLKSTEVAFMENKVNNITLLINSPTGDWNDIQQVMKIEEVEILFKEAGQNTIKIVDTISSSELGLINSPILPYIYKSIKPWKTLPDREILRVHDQVPVRALAQELIGNRIVYGNYIDKHTAPLSLNYSTDIVEKDVDTQIEYQNQNLKQNRTYQVGIVLSDRYGRQSTVILSSLDDSRFANTIKGSSLFNKYKSSPFSQYPLGNLFGPDFYGNQDVWDGDNIELQFWSVISSGLTGNIPNYENGEPGLYDAITNPLGWYSYKIVVKQTEQDYYNIYFPGILNGYCDGEAYSSGATEDEPICHFVLHGDNINKVPRDLTLVGPTQTTFRTGRPSAQEDPSYYQFVDSGGLGFTVDPFSEEGEKLLKERDRIKDLDSGSQITNASVKLSLRLNNVVPDTSPVSGGFPLTAVQTTTSQAYPETNLDIVTTIGTGSDLGLWDPAAVSPFNTANVFYGYKDNPYVAKINVSNPLNTGLTGPHPLSGRLNFTIVMDTSALGSGYKAGSTNIPCTIPNVTASGGRISISGFKIDINGALSLNEISVASSGMGWDSLQAAPGSISGCKISGAGDGQGEFTLSWTKTDFVGKMAPSLAIYETEPLKSKLDIYWETSTSGLIDELNTAIETDDITTPVAFVGDFGPVYYLQNENMDIGTYVTGGIYPADSNGNRITTGPNTATLLDVTDGTGASRFQEFIIENDTGGLALEDFKIKTNAYFMAGQQNNTEGKFTFDINMECPSDDYLQNGSFTNTQLSLGPYNLDNSDPSFVNPPAEDNFIVTNAALNAGRIKVYVPFESNVHPNWDGTVGLAYNSSFWSTASQQTIRHPATVLPNNCYNNTTGVYECQVTGNYNLQVFSDISTEFVLDSQDVMTKSPTINLTPIEIYSCGMIIGQIFLRKVGSTTHLATQEIAISKPGVFFTGGGGISGFNWSAWDHREWTSSSSGVQPQYSDAASIQGGSTTGFGWANIGSQASGGGPQRTGGSRYILETINTPLVAGDKIEMVLECKYVGNKSNSLNGYGYAFESFDAWYGLAFLQAKQYREHCFANVTIGTTKYVVTNLTGSLSGGLIHTFNVLNGSHNVPANSLKTDDFRTPTLSNDYNGLFYLSTTTTPGEIELRNNAGGVGGAQIPYEIIIIARDGAGASVQFGTYAVSLS